jgi:hypothetical protein
MTGNREPIRLSTPHRVWGLRGAWDGLPCEDVEVALQTQKLADAKCKNERGGRDISSQ